jgi:hypothetical protein
MSDMPRTLISNRPRLTDLPILMGFILAVLGLGFNSFQLSGELLRVAHTRTGHPGASNLHALLILGFLLSIVGLVLRSRVGLILSILSLTFVLFLYAKWYQFSYGLWKLIHEFSPSPEFIPPHPLGLLYASWLDIAILFAVVVVLAWQIKFLIGTLRHHNESK